MRCSLANLRKSLMPANWKYTRDLTGPVTYLPLSQSKCFALGSTNVAIMYTVVEGKGSRLEPAQIGPS